LEGELWPDDLVDAVNNRSLDIGRRFRSDNNRRFILDKIEPIRSEADYEAALAEVERLWGARSGTLEADRLDILATLIDAYESEHHPIDPPDPIEAIKFRMEQQGLTRKDLE
jgi:HTH-type transcriptional regulator / antitoxin HigA